MKFTKYHALGNDQIVVNPKDLTHEITSSEIIAICDRHYGIGSDGILYGPMKSKSSDFKVKIFNPDASEAEVSGNGLRIFSRYLWDSGLVGEDQFSIETKGGDVFSSIHESGKFVTVDMGKVRFTHDPQACPNISSEMIFLQDASFEFYRASIGNPHCVIPVDSLSPSLAKTYGQLIENDPCFSNRTNVQFMKVIDRNAIQIEIWERGAGYTLASGSSSTASAAVAYALGLCDSTVSVHLPGGVIEIALNEEFYAIMRGSVCKIGEGSFASEALEVLK